MTGIILHNYPQSPVAEKVRVGLGIKGLAWRSVEIPRLPPKPDLIPLTGGYRRTPVMQIGADIFCDSQMIFRALEEIHPSPSFFPDGAAMTWGLSRWIDGEFFTLAVKLVLGSAGDALDPDFAADRGRLYLGTDWQARLAEANEELPHYAAQVRAGLNWIDHQLANWDFLTGTEPGYADALLYHAVWFIRGRWAAGPEFLSEFPDLIGWEDRVREIGHGDRSDLAAAEALDIARDAVTETPETADPHDPQKLAPGDFVSISPDLDGGEQAVEGRIRAVTANMVAILREDDRVGEVCVHFPRAGYRVTRL
ncbi:MAG: glutathione S-transferase family protein [Pseudomonadota bacterium]